ncbi:MAG: hypothetical protein WAM52_14225 [Steroidobacteraceae bacterium]
MNLVVAEALLLQGRSHRASGLPNVRLCTIVPMDLRGIRHVLAAMLFLTGAVGSLHAQAVTQAYFAGVAYTSAAADTAKAFRYITGNLAAGGIASLDATLRREIERKALPLNIIFDQLGSTHEESEATALALAIDRESTSVDQIAGQYKIRIEIDAQALFFNFKTKQILGGYPFALEYIDLVPSAPGSGYVSNLYHNLIFGGTGRASLVSQFIDTLQHAQVPSAAARHLRITAVVLAPKAQEYIHALAPEADLNVIRDQIAQQFGEYLAADQHVSLLPYQSNQALGGAMPERFTEGDAYDFSIPPADYGITITVDGFKKLLSSRDSVSSVYLYGAFATLTVNEPLSGRVYFSQQMRQGAAKTVPATEGVTDDWAASYETLLVLFDHFARSISTPDEAWVRSSMPGSRAAQRQLLAVQELIQSCR